MGDYAEADHRRQLRERAIAELKALEHEDTEAAHMKGDGILCDLLTDLGFGDVVAEWAKLDKWYA